MIIAVGSSNPTKVDAVKRVAAKLFSDFEVFGVNAPSGVSDMPMSDEETIKGAKNRAINAKSDYDYGVGIEGGVNDTNQGMFLSAWAAVSNGVKVTIGNTSRIRLPDKVAVELRKGRELGPVMDEFSGKTNIKHGLGTTGLLTNGLVTRSESYEQAIIHAFMQLLNKEYYQ